MAYGNRKNDESRSRFVAGPRPPVFPVTSELYNPNGTLRQRVTTNTNGTETTTYFNPNGTSTQSTKHNPSGVVKIGGYYKRKLTRKRGGSRKRSRKR